MPPLTISIWSATFTNLVMKTQLRSGVPKKWSGLVPMRVGLCFGLLATMSQVPADVSIAAASLLASDPNCVVQIYPLDLGGPIIEAKAAASGCASGVSKSICVEMQYSSSGSQYGPTKCSGRFLGTGFLYRPDFGCNTGIWFDFKAYIKIDSSKFDTAYSQDVLCSSSLESA